MDAFNDIKFTCILILSKIGVFEWEVSEAEMLRSQFFYGIHRELNYNYAETNRSFAAMA